MTLQELGQSYMRQDEILRERVARLKTELAALRGDDARRMQQRIRGLYQMARDCRRIGWYLTTYYDREEDQDGRRYSFL